MKKANHAALLLLVSLAFAGCASESSSDGFEQSNSNSAPISVTGEDAPEQAKSEAEDRIDRRRGDSPTANPQNPVSLDKTAQTSQQPGESVERKIIRNAQLQLESGSPEEVQQKITAIAEANQGFVIQSRKRSGEKRSRDAVTVSMSIRVPAVKFNETLAEIRKAADRVVDESVTGLDVTEEFIDIEARLKTKKALEEQFIAIMKQSKSVQDALNVQRELASVRGEIERIEGRKRFLENQSSLSTIKIEIQTPTAISGSSSGFYYELKDAVRDGFDAALSFVLILIRVLIALIPFLLLVVLPILLLLRYVWRSYKKKRLAKKIAEEISEEIIDE